MKLKRRPTCRQFSAEALEPRCLLAAFDLLQTYHAGDAAFGYPVVAAGNNVFVGETGYLSGYNSGAVHQFNAASGERIRALDTPGGGGPTDFFGTAMAIEGSEIAISTPRRNVSSVEDGEVFVLDTESGNLKYPVLNPTPASYDYFGSSIAITHATVAITAPGDDTQGQDAGAVYLLDRGNPSSPLRAAFKPTSYVSGVNFGTAIANVGDNFAVVARLTVNPHIPGEVYLIDGRTGAAILDPITNPGGSSNGFGAVVAGLGNDILVGAPFEPGTGTTAAPSGLVYLFSGATGALLRTFSASAPDIGFGLGFGTSIAAIDGNVLVGAPGAYYKGSYQISGAAYLLDGRTGEIIHTFVNPSDQPYTGFGEIIANRGNDILITLFDTQFGRRNTTVNLYQGLIPTPPPNRSPVANNDTVTVPYNGSKTFDVLANDSDPDGNKLTAVNVSKLKSGTPLNRNADGTFTYKPTTVFSGQDSFTYQAFDGLLYSDPATVTITVSPPIDRAPVAFDDPSYKLTGSGTLSIPARGVLTNDTDPDGTTASLTAKQHTNGVKGKATLLPDGSFTYTPYQPFSGTDSFTYQASDGTLTSNVATVTITVSLPPPVLPDIIMTRATTEDAQSVTVDYEIANSSLNQALIFYVYRSDKTTLTANSQIFAVATLDGGYLTQAKHPNTRLSLKNSSNNPNLVPDTTRPYVIVVANPSLNNVTPQIKESTYSNNTSYFQKHSLGIVVHGFELLLALNGFTVYGSKETPVWEVKMADSLKNLHKYELVHSFNWVVESATQKINQTVQAGDRLYKQVLLFGSILANHPGDVVDVHFIGHSRGAVVISRALQDLDNSASPALRGGYIKFTMLDPHPANNFKSVSIIKFYNADINVRVKGIRVGQGLETGYVAFQAKTQDPIIVIPKIVKSIEQYFQVNSTQLFTLQGGIERYLNLWGNLVLNTSLVNHSAAKIVQVNLSNMKFPYIGIIGHSQVHDWYQLYVINKKNPFV